MLIGFIALLSDEQCAYYAYGKHAHDYGGYGKQGKLAADGVHYLSFNCRPVIVRYRVQNDALN